MQGGAVYFTWKSWVSLLMLFDIVQTYGQWQTNMKILRLLTIVGAIPIGIYNILVGGYTGAVNQFLQAISAAAALYHKHYRKPKKDSNMNAIGEETKQIEKGPVVVKTMEELEEMENEEKTISNR